MSPQTLRTKPIRADVRHRPDEATAEGQIEAREDVAAPSTEVAGDEPVPISGLPKTGTL
jgi:hypothetical protein